jgi:hypothetical protein
MDGGRAAEWIASRDEGALAILSEMIEHANEAMSLWRGAVSSSATDLNVSSADLAKLQVVLENLMRVEVDDLISLVIEAGTRVDVECDADGP